MTCRLTTLLSVVLRPLQKLHDSEQRFRCRTHWPLESKAWQSAGDQTSSCMPWGERGTLSKATLATRPSSLHSSAVAC